MLGFSSCGMAQILGLSREEAISRLENGDIGFILDFQLPDTITGDLAVLKPVSQIKPMAEFFTALLAEASGSMQKSSLLYTLALEDKSPVIRREACKKLMLPVLRGSEEFAAAILNILKTGDSDDDTAALKNACLYRLNQLTGAGNSKNLSPWNTVIRIASDARNIDGRTAAQDILLHGDALSFFMTNPAEQPWLWVRGELAGLGYDSFSPAEEAAISARAAAAASRYDSGLDYFETFLSEDNPDLAGIKLFLQYPELVRDLGRVCQYAPNRGKEGAGLFTFLEEKVNADQAAAGPALEYLLQYYMGRIYRQQGQPEISNSAFAKALEYAPDAAQADACIWYILTDALNENPQSAIPQFEKYIPLMNSPVYFDDVLDRLCQYLVSKRNWETLDKIYSLLAELKTGGTAIAQYAWILGRAAEENYYSGDSGGGNSSGSGNNNSNDSTDYYQLIYNNKNSSLYYRAMSGARLDLNLVPDVLPEANTKIKPRPEAEFLLGFTDYGAVNLALPYIREYENSLSIPELRLLAQALAKSGRTDQSLNLISRYMEREDFEPTRQDFILYYPRPFNDLIEKYADLAGINPAMLFALVRTESFFMPGAVSRSGAVGLTQLMPDTAADMAARIARRPGQQDYRTENGIDLKNPETNIHIGSFYLNYLIETMGSPVSAIIAYNGGMGRARRWQAAGKELPEDLLLETVDIQETREFGRRVTAAAAVYGYLYYGLNMGEVIADIYQ